MAALWLKRPENERTRNHVFNLLGMVGDKSGQTWDTAFAMQALLAHPEAARRAEPALRRAYAYLRQAQLVEEIPECRR